MVKERGGGKKTNCGDETPGGFNVSLGDGWTKEKERVGKDSGENGTLPQCFLGNKMKITSYFPTSANLSIKPQG